MMNVGMIASSLKRLQIDSKDLQKWIIDETTALMNAGKCSIDKEET